jgi:hypothetical protein
MAILLPSLGRHSESRVVGPTDALNINFCIGLSRGIAGIY